MIAAESHPLLRKIFHKGNYVTFALVVIFALSIFLRYYGFNQPHKLTFDEGLYANLLAEQLKEDPTNYSTQFAYQFQLTQGKQLPEYLDRPLFKHPPLYCYLIALSYSIFGVSDLAAVSVSIVLGCLMILAVFYLGRILYDNRVGLLAALFLCIEPVHWVCSERIWMETTLSFFMLLGILFFVLGWKQKYYLVLSGLAIGLAMLTKYPAAILLAIIFSFAICVDRALLKQKSFWFLCFLSFLVFSPWIIWNWRVYGNLVDAFSSGYSLNDYTENVLRVLVPYRTALFIVCLGGGVLYAKISLIAEKKSTMVLTCILACTLCLAVMPFLQMMLKEAFIWKNTVLVEWYNPFGRGPWHFYLTRLSELSPLFIFGFLSVFFIFGKNKGDKLLLFSVAWILGAFILLGNYQSRYILPAVPFLVILSARWQVWVYDKLSDPGAFRVALKILLVGVGLYFTAKTLRVDWQIAIGPDFGYF